MAGPENRPLGASSHSEMAELAGHVLANPLDITPRQAQSLAGCVLALFDQRVNPRQLRRLIGDFRKTELSVHAAALVDKLEAMLFPPKPAKQKKPKAAALEMTPAAKKVWSDQIYAPIERTSHAAVLMAAEARKRAGA